MRLGMPLHPPAPRGSEQGCPPRPSALAQPVYLLLSPRHRTQALGVPWLPSELVSKPGGERNPRPCRDLGHLQPFLLSTRPGICLPSAFVPPRRGGGAGSKEEGGGAAVQLLYLALGREDMGLRSPHSTESRRLPVHQAEVEFQATEDSHCAGHSRTPTCAVLMEAPELPSQGQGGHAASERDGGAPSPAPSGSSSRSSLPGCVGERILTRYCSDSALAPHPSACRW